ncbi:hypothetical protein [uncultured Maricaulis sp.]|uniref:hypothetical protein n=1 Tax=uncultured Maricaulis sp. TaxID=174710 RepID=UPI0030D76B27|tara:strand:- start:70185 stop:71168 length:984 start_codon:yes stop_codon:yes gene_type:complete
MAGFDGLLMRDSLNDTGTIPSPGYPYYSPDIICHAQVADPQTYFTQNYASDPNQPVELGSQTNLIYTRTKNLAPTTMTGWYVHAYRASSSLFMTPSIWKGNPLSTRTGNPYVAMAPVPANAVGVGPDAFLLSGLANHLFCLIAVASPTVVPTIPDSFASYGDYILWVRQNQNVCGRNLTYLQSYPNRQFSRLDNLTNPNSSTVPVLAKVEVLGNLPAGTTFGVQCAPANMTASGNTSNTTVITGSGIVPANFNGTVTTWGSLPSGTNTWPAGATLKTTLYYGQDSRHAAHQYGESWDSFDVGPKDIEGMPEDGVLVRLGDTGTVFLA